MKHLFPFAACLLLLSACKEKSAPLQKPATPINQKIESLLKEAAAATDDNKKAGLFGEASELLIEKGDYRQAMLAARQGERANPTQKQCLTSIAEAQISEGKVEEAATTLKDTLQKHSGYGRAHFVQGNLSASRGDFAGALKSYATADKMKFADVRLHLNAGGVNLKAKKPRDAAKNYARAMAEYPDVAEGYLGAGIAARSDNKKSDAKKYFEKFLALSPNASQADRVKAWLKNL